MVKFIIELILGRISKKLDGHKTNIGGIGLVLLGISGVIAYMFPDSGLPPMDLESAFGYVAAGFGVMGIGGKLEKVKSQNEIQGKTDERKDI